MKYLFLLSGDYIDIAKEEVFSLFNIKNYKIDRRLLFAESDENEIILKKIQRLALTKSIYEVLFKCKIAEIERLMQNFDWNSVYRGSFCLRIHNLNGGNTGSLKKSNIRNRIKKYSEKNLAKYIWRSVQKPKVNLENPKTRIELFLNGDKAHCGLLIFENKEDFESRKTHLRPFSHPSSLHPKLARALVNITGMDEDEILLDPFCGTGGFLIESGLIGIKTIGYDISKNMVNGCMKNLKHFKIKKYKIIEKNALNINGAFDYVVTDLPYGLNSNIYLEYNKKSIDERYNKINLKINKKDAIKNLEKFYLIFLKNLRKILKNKAVIILPNYVDYKSLLKKSKFKIEKEFSIYVHRSLTRKIVRVIKR